MNPARQNTLVGLFADTQQIRMDFSESAVTFHKLNDSTTRVTVQLDWEPEGLPEKVGAALGVDDRAIKGDLKNFKEFIEGAGGETGAWRGEVPR